MHISNGVNSEESVTVASRKKILGWLLAGLVLVAALWLVFILTGRVLRRIAFAQITELTNTQIDAESINFNLDGSVFIQNLVIRPYQSQSDDEAILKAKAVYARFGIGSLLLLQPRLKEIIVNDFIFNAQYDLDADRWNVAGLKIGVRGGGSGKMPLVNLERGTLQYSKVSNGRRKVVATAPLDVTFAPDGKDPHACIFSITTAKRSGFGEGILAGSWQPGRVKIAGGISLADFPVFGRTWAINLLDAELNYDTSTYSLKVKIKDLLGKHSSAGDIFASDRPLFLEKFGPFNTLQKFFNRYRPTGRVDIDLQALGNLHQLADSTLRGKVHCKDISICNRRFPYPVEHLVGQIGFTEKSFSLNNLCGRHGDVKLFFNGWSKDFGPNRKYQFRITSDNMTLDNDLYNALSKKQKKLWSAFSPSGVAAIDYSRSRRSKTDYEKLLAVELLDVEAAYQPFPYPLKNLTGCLLFDRDSITVSDVVSQLNESKITLNGKVTACGTTQPICDISINAEHIPLDSTLAEALQKGQEHFHPRFNTAGLMSIDNLTGRIWSEPGSKQEHYNLSLKAKQLELNNDLFNLLAQPLAKLICELNPKGKVNLIADLNKTGSNRPDYRITVDCLGNSLNCNQFPYPLRDITGSLTITKHSVELHDITAAPADILRITPDASTIKINGQITLADNAFSGASFQLSAGDIFFDEQLAAALPEAAQSFYAGLLPAGRLDLNFENIKIASDNKGGKSVHFAGEIKLKDCDFSPAAEITDLDAVLKTKGLYKTRDGFFDGQAELIADNLRIKGKSLTTLKAAVDYNRPLQCWLAKNLVADCYGGRLAGKFELVQPTKDASQYQLQIGFENIDLKRFLSDSKGPLLPLGILSDADPQGTGRNSSTSGKMSGSLSVSTVAGDNSSRFGRCRLRITDMQVGKLSPLTKLLQLKLSESEHFAFDRMLVDSYIKNNRLFFKEVDLAGKDLAFNGSGSMDLQTKDINLVLFARGHHRLATEEPSVLQSLAEGLGIAVVRMEITGNFYDPHVKTRALPVIKEAVRILGTKLTKPIQ
jgi:hypothetical protein